MSAHHHLSTLALTAGHDLSKHGKTIAVPIYQSTAYRFDSTDHAAALFNLSESGNIYTRLTNPTNAVLEERLAALEGGIAGVVTSSGTAAVATTLQTLLKSGEHIVCSNSVYGGTYNMLGVTLPRLGITTTFVDPSDLSHFEAAIQPNTRAIFLESIGNPKLDVLDIEGVAEIARKHKIPLIVDNTVPTPALLNPIKFGANIVIHSLTKYINGNGTALGGAIIDAGTFDWSSGKFEEFTQPSPGYHGLVYHEALGPAAFIAKVRIEGLRDFGSALSPLNAFHILQGLETLSLRIKKHSENTLKLASWLVQQDEVAWVNFPGAKDERQQQLRQKYLPEGVSGLLTFGLKGGFAAAKKLTDATQLFKIAANFGDSKSIIVHPASTTHQQLTEDQQASTGVTPDLIRLSVGLEAVEDLIDDLARAIKA
ncbi:MAG: O-acetylhomoserine aminocarboxypropyltransferase/cysteine synthase family protein [Flavobacteriaceae bacterium]|jgi:O-acetylhomoserine (thiol)-lyase